MSSRQQRYIFIGVAIVAIAVGIYLNLTSGPGQGGYGDVSVHEARELIDSKPELVILDVRSLSEYESGHIEGAMLIPVGELQRRLDELNRDDKFLVYCRTGNRSSQAVEILMANGFDKIYHMAGGTVAWSQAGYPLVQ